MPTALVTGGTSGIGASFARHLARRSFDLVIVARDEDRLATTAASLAALSGKRVETISADLSDRADVDRVAARIADPADPIDVLVNNAGFGVHTKLTDPDVSAHDLAIDVMIRTVLVLSGAAARSMRERGGGTIINVSSVAGYITMGSYSAVKAWVTAYTESLATELRGTRVHVTALCPGWVHTEFHERAGIRTSSIPSFLWIEADRLVEEALRDSARGKVISVPTKRFQVLTWFTRHLPRSTIRSISAAISSKRSTPAAGRSATAPSGSTGGSEDVEGPAGPDSAAAAE